MAQLFVPNVGLELQDQTATHQSVDVGIPNSVNPSKAFDPMVNVATAYEKYQRQVQETADDAQAQEHINRLTEDVSMLQTDLQNADGEDAQRLYKAQGAQVKSLIEKHASGLDGRAKLKFNQKANMIETTASAQGYATHVAKAKKWDNDVRAVSIKNIAQQAISAFGTPEFETKIEEGRQQVIQLLEANGKGGNQAVVAESIRGFSSDVYKNAIKAEIDQDRTGSAASYLHKYSKDMDQSDVLTLESLLFQKNKQLARQAASDATQARNEFISSRTKLINESRSAGTVEGFKLAQLYTDQLAKVDPELARVMSFNNGTKIANKASENIKTALQVNGTASQADWDLLKENSKFLSPSDVQAMNVGFSSADSSYITKLVESLKGNVSAQYQATVEALKKDNLTNEVKQKMLAIQDKITTDDYFAQLGQFNTAKDFAGLGNMMFKTDTNGEYLKDGNGAYQLTDLAQRARDADPTKFGQFYGDWVQGNIQANQTKLEKALRVGGYDDHEKLDILYDIIDHQLEHRDGALTSIMQLRGLDPNNKKQRKEVASSLYANHPDLFKGAVDEVEKESKKYLASLSFEGLKDYTNMESSIREYQRLLLNASPDGQLNIKTSVNPFGKLPQAFQQQIRDTYGANVEAFNNFVERFNNFTSKDTVGDVDKFNAMMLNVEKGLYDTFSSDRMKLELNSLLGVLNIDQINTIEAKYNERSISLHGELIEQGGIETSQSISNFLYDQKYSKLKSDEQKVVNMGLLALQKEVTRRSEASEDPLKIQFYTAQVLSDENFLAKLYTIKKQNTFLEDGLGKGKLGDKLDTISDSQQMDTSIRDDSEKVPWYARFTSTYKYYKEGEMTWAEAVEKQREEEFKKKQRAEAKKAEEAIRARNEKKEKELTPETKEKMMNFAEDRIGLGQLNLGQTN